ncbi:MAG: cysteine-rich CWC family protein [Colwellia sp.]|nr:cysteine-rich CWC family protein [Colwellia sp.]
MTNQIDDTICPLCQTSNSCEVNSPTSCWCAVANIPPALLEQVSKSHSGKACICQTCIDQFNQKIKEVT